MSDIFDSVLRIAKDNEYKVLLEENLPLSKRTSFKIGGCAKISAFPENTQEFLQALSLADKAGVPSYVMGRGTNVLVCDEGFSGMVIFTEKMNGTDFSENRVEAYAGVSITYLSRVCGQKGLSGLEFACGIPGSVGGAVVMNAGAYDGEIKDVFSDCVIYRQFQGVLECKSDEAEFSYRSTSFLKKGDIVLRASFLLTPMPPETIRQREEELLARRRDKQPLEYASAGSTFKRPEGHFAAKLIQDAGLKGFCVGDAMVSEKHAGFVINLGNASARDVIKLIKIVRARVLDTFGVDLEPEIRYLGTRGEERFE